VARRSVKGGGSRGVVVKRASDKRLNNYKSTFRTETVLLGQLERHIMQRAIEADPERRSDHVIHPSEIVKKDVCPRKIYYRISGNAKPEFAEPNPSFWMERMFEEGHDIHGKWQGWLWDMGKLYGYFECIVCDAVWYGHSPDTCNKCGAPRQKLKYREVPVFSDRYLLGGHADGQVDEGLVEIKSIGVGTVRIEAPGFYDSFQSGEWTLQQLWDNIRRPFPGHVKQGMVYCHCKSVEQMVFIYECKWNQSVKEFTVRYNEAIIDRELDMCLDIKYAVAKERTPERPRWAHPEASACKACPYRGACWNEGKAGRPRIKRVRYASDEDYRRAHAAT
jgi:hypothetical protein